MTSLGGAEPRTSPDPSAPTWGIAFVPVNRWEEAAKAAKRTLSKPPTEKGALVIGVRKNGPAYKAGISPLDVITHLEDTPVDEPAVFQKSVLSLPVGRPLKVAVLRPREANAVITWEKLNLKLTPLTYSETYKD